MKLIVILGLLFGPLVSFATKPRLLERYKEERRRDSRRLTWKSL